MMMMDGREAQGIMTGQVILRRRRTRCVRLHDMKQVDEIRKGDGARKKVIVDRCA
jgi:hypothetical protein